MLLQYAMPTSIKNTSDDPSRAHLASLTYYPAYTHSEHELSREFVKMPAFLIRKLHVPTGWEASHPWMGEDGAAPSNLDADVAFPLFHYLNHPLPYVQLCGVVIDISYNMFLQAWVIQLDDSSESLVDILIKKCMDPAAPKRQVSSTRADYEPRHLQGGDIIPRYVLDWLGCSWVSKQTFDVRRIEIGSILRAKGRLSPWKKGRQLLVERFDIFRSTAEEITFWNEMSEDFNLVLCKPWIMSSTKQKEIRLKFEAAKLEREKHLRRAARKARKVEKFKKSGRETSKSNQSVVGLPKYLGRPEQAKEISPMIGEGSSDPHPVKKGLASSHQPPKVESSSAGESTGYTKEVTTVIELEVDTEKVCQSPMSEHAKEMVPTISKPPHSLVPEAKTTVSELDVTSTYLDMGSPSQWDSVHLADPKQPTRVSTGSAWLDIRAHILSRQVADGFGEGASTQVGTTRLPSGMEEWDNLDL